MPKKTLEYRCLLISPSDVAEERDALTKAVGEWNAQIGRGLGTRVELVRWESHAVPDMSAPPQAIINEQLLDGCDLAIAVFWSRIGTPTQEFASGSVEEISRLIERGIRVLVYFSERPVSPTKLDLKQMERLAEVRARFQQQGLLATYSDTAQLCSQVNLHLTNVVAELLERDTGLVSPSANQSILTAPKPDVRVRVDAGFLQSEIRPMLPLLMISVQNHSPVSVYIASVYLEAKNNALIVPNGDYLSGQYWEPRELLPGQSLKITVAPTEIEKQRNDGKIICAAATDQIGRVYRSSEAETVTALDNLFDYYVPRLGYGGPDHT